MRVLTFKDIMEVGPVDIVQMIMNGISEQRTQQVVNMKGYVNYLESVKKKGSTPIISSDGHTNRDDEPGVIRYKIVLTDVDQAHDSGYWLWTLSGMIERTLNTLLPFSATNTEYEAGNSFENENVIFTVYLGDYEVSYDKKDHTTGVNLYTLVETDNKNKVTGFVKGVGSSVNPRIKSYDSIKSAKRDKRGGRGNEKIAIAKSTGLEIVEDNDES